MKIAVALVSHESVPMGFAYDLARLCAYTAANLPPGVEFDVNMITGTYVHSARQELLEAILSHNVTHILWIDTDMRFPRDALIRLIMHKREVVGINYSKRYMDGGFVALKSISWDRKGRSVRLETNADSTGLEEVEGMGFGLVLMRTQCLRKLPSLDKQPWFFFEWLPGRRMVGEDTYFWRILRKQGTTLYVDHDLSKECKHIGQFEYECAHAEMSVKMDREIASEALVEV